MRRFLNECNDNLKKIIGSNKAILTVEKASKTGKNTQLK